MAEASLSALRKDVCQIWGNSCYIHGENSFKVDLRNLDIRKLQHFQKLKVEQGSRQFNPLAAMAASISLSGFGCDPLYERVAPIFSKKQQPSSKKDYYSQEPLAAAATISLSSFRGANQLGFDAFYKKLLHKQDSCQSQYRKHTICRMTRTYRNVVQPIVAKASKLEYKKIMTAMAIATNLISQPKLQDMLWIATLTMPINFYLGMLQERTYHFAPPLLTFVCTHIQLFNLITTWTVMPKTTVVHTLGGAILGYALGSMYEQQSRLKKASTAVGGSDDAAMPPPNTETSFHCSFSSRFASFYFLLKFSRCMIERDPSE